MSGYTVPLSLVRTRRSNLHRQRRDMAITAGDDIALSLTLYERDTDQSPMNIAGAAATLSILDDDTGATIATAAGAVVSASAGRMDIPLLAALTADLSGRYGVVVQIDFASGPSTIMHGVMVIYEGGEATLTPEQQGIIIASPLVATFTLGSVVVVMGLTMSISAGVLSDQVVEGPIVLFDLLALSFPDTAPSAQSSALTVLVTNDGTEDLIISGVSVSGDYIISTITVP